VTLRPLSKNPRDPPEELSLFNGERSVLVNISGAFSQRVDLYVDDIEKVVNEFRDQLPSEISLEKVYDESYYFKEKFNTLYTSILFAILIVIGISYFLLGFKSALIVGSVIPLNYFFSVIWLHITWTAFTSNLNDWNYYCSRLADR
jgi:multidrug efflux pump subunit AcrB